jgi:hypothetical protein
MLNTYGMLSAATLSMRKLMVAALASVSEEQPGNAAD